MALELIDDPTTFLDAASAYLAADPVVTTVVATVTRRAAAGGLRADDAPYRWWALARAEDGSAGGAVTGVAMRTAPFAPYPVYVLPMADGDARALARLLHERGEQVDGVNGALPAARLVAEETARLTGRSVRVHEHLRLFEVAGVRVPTAPPGRLRLATRADAELCLAWFRDFGRAAAEQAGRSEPHATEDFSLEKLQGRIDAGVVWLWEDEAGAPVHLTAANPPANGVARIGPVYTPRERRGLGYASRAVAEVSRGFVEAGVRCCLFTDQANPTSNRIYEAIGYRAVVDMANLVLS